MDKYTIVERDGIRRIYNWLQCFTLQSIKSECAACGLQVVGYWGDVAGATYDLNATEFAIALKAAGDESGAE
ncbi:MAG: hypothetical protein KJ970_17310 [Candidatus Eisenbacteria bacterium]|uniref:Uncharacterized protein n=1 Tax=Eiseniibacteriota bacterium TaxID=2212470 RepID=A0A948W4W5_UNCEI|nr:hypothetical protein [Candidatus Eisenbacteria bacterium]MBU2692677.1 hypothetical protein [Candidatus Eisenbacteria bacterium]